MPLNKPFQHQPSSITSYDWTDIDNTGVISFYLAQTKTSTGTEQILTKSLLYSEEKDETGTTAAATATLIIDKDFDLTSFNTPTTLRGTAILNISALYYTDTGNMNGYLIAKLRKWDGTTETEIASAQSVTSIPTAGIAGMIDTIHCIPIVIPKTHFKKGETLRLTIEAWGLTSSGTCRITIGTDPQNRGGVYISGPKSILNTPFDTDR